MRNKINYFFILGVTIYLTLLFNLEEMRFLLGFELMLPLVLEAWLFLVWRKIEVELEIPCSRLTEGDILPLTIRVDNRSWFCVSRIFVEVEVEDCYTGKREKGRIWLFADERKQTKISKEQTVIYCGKYLWRVKCVGIYDYLGMFGRKKQKDYVREVLVLPEALDMTINRFEVQEGVSAEGETYDEHRCGDDVSEIFQIRPYRGGDTMQRIHWKMTAKEDELMVKDYGYPLSCQFYLCLDFSMEEERWRRDGYLDEFLELALSLSLELSQQYVFECVWCEAGENVRRMHITKAQDVHEMIDAMIYAGPCKRSFSRQEFRKLLQVSGTKCPIYCLQADQKLYNGETLWVDLGGESG